MTFECMASHPKASHLASEMSFAWQQARGFRGNENISRDKVQKAASSDNALKGTPLWLSNYVPTPPVQFLPGHEKPQGAMNLIELKTL